MKLWRITWTTGKASVFLLLTCFIGRIDEGASSFVPPERTLRLLVFAHYQPPIPFKSNPFSRHDVLLNERRPRDKVDSGSVVPQSKSRVKNESVGRQRQTTTDRRKLLKTRKVSKLATTKSNYPKTAGDEEGTKVVRETDEVDVHHVSDATALLACRAYLIRRRRLGPWKKQQERRDRLMRSSLYRKGSVSSSSVSSSPARGGSGTNSRAAGSHDEDRPDHIGYFWEDTAELKYYVSPRRRRALNNRHTMEPKEEQLEEGIGDEFDVDATDGSDVRGGVQMIVGAEYDEPCDTTGEEGCNDYDDDEDSETSSWEFASRSLTSEEEAAVDDLCDELDDDEFQADDGGTEDTGVLVGGGAFGGTGPSLGYYDAFDDVPPPSYVRRSQAAKKCWSQPQFRQKWYEARWGGAKVRAARESKQVDADKDRLRRVSSTSPLPMEAVAEMSEEEIAHAIRTYLSSKQKKRQSKERSEATLAPDSSSPEFGGSSAVAPASLESLLPTKEVLQQKQIERSKRAAKAYQTRLANQRFESPPAPRSHGANTRRRTTRQATNRHFGGTLGGVGVTYPSEAMERIERLLNAGGVPPISDVELILKPIKLARRKQMLRRILSDCFGLRGKCVPSANEQSESAPTLIFVTKASVEELGAFCLLLIRDVEPSK
jgi:hypothetical protein